MILRRIALFVALAVGLAMTQLPEFVQQYRQRLDGAIDELAAVVAQFDRDSGGQGLSESQGIDRLRANGDALARARGDAMADDVARLADLRAVQASFRDDGPLARLVTLATHYDSRIAHGAYDDFQPAVPTSPEALGLGLAGFLFGGGLVRLTGHQVRRRRLRRLAARPAT